MGEKRVSGIRVLNGPRKTQTGRVGLTNLAANTRRIGVRVETVRWPSLQKWSDCLRKEGGGKR